MRNAAPPMPLSNRTRLGRYEIRSLIGEGGMGEVYLAWDTELQRAAALKVLRTDVAADEHRMLRFIHEARTASALNHPNILTIYEIKQDSPVPFIATEFIGGETLRARVSRGALPVAEALDIAVQTASALAAAHEARVVHRDVKPENIMLRPDGYVKVLDFGVAKLAEAEDSSTEAATLFHTRPGAIVGTARHMSPEQARGEEVDERTDIFSFAIVLYEMLTGQPPFNGKTSSDVAAAILRDDPPPLKNFLPSGEVPPRLQEILSRALVKDRDERYPKMREMLQDLKSVREELTWSARHGRTAEQPQGAGTATTPSNAVQTNITASHELAANASALNASTSSASASNEFASNDSASQHHTTSSAEYLVGELKQHKRGVLVALLALALALGAGAYLFLGRSAQAINSVAVLPFSNEGGDASTEYLSDGITESLINNLSQLPDLKVIARSSVFRYKGRELDVQRIGRELGVSAVLTGRVVQRGDQLSVQTELVDVASQTQLWGEKYNRKFSDIIPLQDDISREISENLRLKLTGAEREQLAKHYTQNARAFQLYWQGRFHWNRRRPEDIREATREFQQAIELDPNFALAYTGLADCYILGNLLQMSPAESMPLAADAARQALAIDDKLAEAHTSLAKIKLSYEWDWPGAESEFKRALALNPGYATAHQWYGVYLSEMGRHDESLEHRKRAQELDPLSLSISTGLGRAYFWARRYDDALAHLRQTLERDPNYADTHWSFGLAYEQKRMYAEATASFQKAVELSRTPEFPEGKPEMLAALAHAYAVAGQRARAQEIVEQLTRLSGAQRYVSPYSIALIYIPLGDRAQAFAWLDRAYAEHDESFIHLKVDPRLDELRADPQFAERLRLIKLAS